MAKRRGAGLDCIELGAELISPGAGALVEGASISLSTSSHDGNRLANGFCSFFDIAGTSTEPIAHSISSSDTPLSESALAPGRPLGARLTRLLMDPALCAGDGKVVGLQPSGKGPSATTLSTTGQSGGWGAINP
jgi:hypothetical protein